MIEYENPWFRVLRKDKYLFVDEPGAKSGAAVMPIVGENIWLLEMLRPAQGGLTTLEIPRGYGDFSETSAECALRELKEETGLIASHAQLILLGKVRPNTAILTSCVDIFAVVMPADASPGSRDQEAERVVEIPLSQLPKLLAQGSIQDSFTLAALSYYWASLD